MFTECDLYNPLSVESVDYCVNNLGTKKYSKGSLIVRQGDAGSIYGVICGGVATVCTIKSGELPPFNECTTFDEIVAVFIVSPLSHGGAGIL